MPLITPIIERWIQDGRRDPEGFWERAAEQVHRFRRWDRVFERIRRCSAGLSRPTSPITR